MPLVSLDDWCEQHATGQVTAIKVDVEGAEQQVLDGASRLIERDHPAILLELEDRHLGRFGSTAQKVFDGLVARGYRAWVLEGRRWVRCDAVSRRMRNHLFVHRDAPAGALA